MNKISTIYKSNIFVYLTCFCLEGLEHPRPSWVSWVWGSSCFRKVNKSFWRSMVQQDQSFLTVFLLMLRWCRSRALWFPGTAHGRPTWSGWSTHPEPAHCQGRDNLDAHPSSSSQLPSRAGIPHTGTCGLPPSPGNRWSPEKQPTSVGKLKNTPVFVASVFWAAK